MTYRRDSPEPGRSLRPPLVGPMMPPARQTIPERVCGPSRPRFAADAGCLWCNGCLQRGFTGAGLSATGDERASGCRTRIKRRSGQIRCRRSAGELCARCPDPRAPHRALDQPRQRLLRLRRRHGPPEKRRQLSHGRSRRALAARGRHASHDELGRRARTARAAPQWRTRRDLGLWLGDLAPLPLLTGSPISPWARRSRPNFRPDRER